MNNPSINYFYKNSLLRLYFQGNRSKASHFCNTKYFNSPSYFVACLNHIALFSMLLSSLHSEYLIWNPHLTLYLEGILAVLWPYAMQYNTSIQQNKLARPPVSKCVSVAFPIAVCLSEDAMGSLNSQKFGHKNNNHIQSGVDIVRYYSPQESFLDLLLLISCC